MNCMEQPRSCGEHVAVSALPALTNGSPPHMRGRLYARMRAVLPSGSPPHMRGIPIARDESTANTRLTPAHAGNTSGFDIRSASKRAHPRPCGEHYTLERDGRQLRGSPPHMRGILDLELVHDMEPGFTPAHAGNTLAETAISSQNQSQQTVKNFSLHTLQHFSVI